MHKNINFSELGGMPFDAQTLEFMQASYADINNCLTAFIGDNVIVAGCIVSGNSVSAGWIIVKGELLPFSKSETGVLETFIIKELKTTLIFEDAKQKQVEITRYAEFGSNDGAIRWDSLTRLPSLFSLNDTLEKHLKNKANPHGVTKKDVGLGNLPNAISDDPATNSSEIIASTAAVNAVIPVIKLPSVKLDLSANTVQIELNQVLDITKYMPVAKVFFNSTHRPPTGDDYDGLAYYEGNVISYIAMYVVDNKTIIMIDYDTSNLHNRDIYTIACTLIKIKD